MTPKQEKLIRDLSTIRSNHQRGRDLVVGPHLEALAQVVLELAAKEASPDDNASLSKGTAANLASILSGLVAWHRSAPASPSDEEERQHNGGFTVAEEREAERAESNTTTRVRARLETVISEGLAKMQGSSWIVSRILDVLRDVQPAWMPGDSWLCSWQRTLDKIRDGARL